LARQPRRPARAAQRQRHPQRRRPRLEERQVEAHQVVVLDHVGVARPDGVAEVRDQAALVARVGRLDRRRQAAAVAQRDEEDPTLRRIERRGLEIELEPVQVAVGQAPEVDPPGLHQVLLDRPDAVVAVQPPQPALRPPAPPGAARRPGQDRLLEGAPAVGGEQVAVRRGRTVQGPDLDARAARGVDVVAVRREQPRSVALALAHQPPVDAPPDHGLPVAIGPDRDDAGGRVPTEQDRVGRAGGGRIGGGHRPRIPAGGRDKARAGSTRATCLPPACPVTIVR